MSETIDELIENVIDAATSVGDGYIREEATLVVAKAALRARIAELEAANCWIPCAERHPDYDVWVLVLANGEVFPAAYSEKNGWYTELAKWGAFITHWRPLPPPPEEKESEG